jgi:hypothetical protein
MKIQKAIGGLAAAIALTVVATGAAQANTAFAGFTDVSPSAGDYTYTGGNGGSFSSNAGGFGVVATGPLGAADIFPGAVFVFGPVTANDTVNRNTTDGGVTFTDTAPFTGGTFTLYGDPAKATVLLSGSFAGAKITATEGSTSGNTINFAGDDVTYTGGLYYNQILAANPGLSSVIGNFSLSLSGVSPAFGVTGNYLNAFTAQGGAGTFDYTGSQIQPVPEPGTIATLSMGALGLLGMGFARRRRSLPTA